ncbi:hypothetical protein [Deefgea sp. CFH1-16]|uniref:hypothetical protein n=1 Tax=Deefgea sp. CFH1-16 TaxID=2675457 RepID=UPI001FFD26EF|nr:hypothetical protein [Deefgea sp. CFH1-16]
MNVFYEEDGSFKVATIQDEQPASLQVEDTRGKRSKIKAANVLLKFDKVGLDDFFKAAQSEAADVDVTLLWDAAVATSSILPRLPLSILVKIQA